MHPTELSGNLRVGIRPRRVRRRPWISRSPAGSVTGPVAPSQSSPPAPGRFFLFLVAGVAGLLGGCQTDAPPLARPDASDVRTYYEYGGRLEVEMSGNVAHVTVEIDREEYRMGGRVWAMASPYIFLFSPATQRAFRDFSGLGGVRVIVVYADGGVLAQALLERAEFNEVTWPRALNVAAYARMEGTQSPGYMRDLVRFGEEHTDFQYNREFIPPL